MPDPNIHLRRQVIAELDEIKDPCSMASGVPMGLSEMGLIGDLGITSDGEVAIKLRLTSPFCHMIGFFKVEAEQRLMKLPGVTAVSICADNGLDWSPAMISDTAQQKRSERLNQMQMARID